jgi:DNA polymerase
LWNYARIRGHSLCSIDHMAKRLRKNVRSAASAGRNDVSLKACTNTGSAADFLPARRTLPQLRDAAKSCRGCDLYCNATQTVFGEGSHDARVMFVGEQPGDQEDRAGKPFVGPSGKMLDQVLDEVGIDRKHDVYVTNAVKHFKWEPRGKMRLHSKPSTREVAACRPWLEAEIELVKPQMIVCLGATAAQSLLGSTFRVSRQRGQVIRGEKWAPWMMATFHPSALLRIPDEHARHKAQAEFRADLKKVAQQISDSHREGRADRSHAAHARDDAAHHGAHYASR